MARPLQSLRLRQATVTSLRADTDLIALGTPPLSTDTDQQRIYGRRSPAVLTWPFVRVIVADEGPLRKGTEIRLTIHSFSKAKYDDELEALNAAIHLWGENRVLALGLAAKAYIAWMGSQVLSDPAEADAYHGVNSFTASIG